MLRSFLTVLILGIFMTLSAADVEQQITDMLAKNSEKVTEILKDKKITKEQQDSQIIEIVDPLFDFDLMGKLCLGKEIYTSLTKDQRERFHKVFNKMIKISYVNKLHLYTDEKLEFEKAKRVRDTRITVMSYLITKTERKPVVYKFYENDSKVWLIYDVNIFGVSVVQTYRNQFSAALQKEDFDTFLQTLGKNDSNAS